ncbi:MAG: hypothetical protein M1828_005530 [Chrysothrix sp. TS-e1954]|nr:MAG: hypothetical protein M1828_005530 [Chrysothrix sp. TS-e1954]
MHSTVLAVLLVILVCLGNVTCTSEYRDLVRVCLESDPYIYEKIREGTVTSRDNMDGVFTQQLHPHEIYDEILKQLALLNPDHNSTEHGKMAKTTARRLPGQTCPTDMRRVSIIEADVVSLTGTLVGLINELHGGPGSQSGRLEPFSSAEIANALWHGTILAAIAMVSMIYLKQRSLRDELRRHIEMMELEREILDRLYTRNSDRSSNKKT